MTRWAVPAGLTVALCGLLWVAWHQPPRVLPAPSVASLRDSLRRDRAEDSARLRAWADSVVRLRGDSLRAVFGRRAAALRPRVVRLVEVDTLRDSIWVSEADVRTVLVADSACRVEVDSLRGVVAIRGAERDSVAAIPKPRPWGWFAAGVAVGLGGCFLR